MLTSNFTTYGHQVEATNLQSSDKEFKMTKSKNLVILGSGWAGFGLIKRLKRDSYKSITLVSPRNFFVFTPLLASSAVGTLEHRCITEPVRYHAPDVQVFESHCNGIDFSKKEITCTSVFDDHYSYKLPYDQLVIACGARSATFGIPGVEEHACFLKDINDSRKIRSRVLQCFERAAQPGVSDEEQSNLLHFAVVGGGPTGIEFSAELHDFVNDDMSKLYPELRAKVKMSVYDISKKILSGFAADLSSYATEKFQRRGIELKMGTSVKEVTHNEIVLADTGERIGYGLLVWSTGLTATDLVRSLDVPAKTKAQKLITDSKLQVLDACTGSSLDGVYALGDCATITDQPLPATAQVAKQQAKYLAKTFNKINRHGGDTDVSDFVFSNMGSMAYIGGWKAVVDFTGTSAKKGRLSGIGAWLFWRSAYFTMSVSSKNKVLIPMYWFLTWIFGRDISRIQ